MKIDIGSFGITGKFAVTDIGWGFQIEDVDTGDQIVTVKKNAFPTPAIARSVADIICRQFSTGGFKT